MRQVQYNVIAPGSIDAFQQVQITARVAGAVDKVAFVEGQTVKQGDLLVIIEVDRYQVAVDQAKAALDKARGRRTRPREAELARRQGAVAAHPGLVAGEEIEQYATSVASTQGRRRDAAQQARPRGAAQPARRVRARARSPASSSRARCRPGSTCSPAPSWPRSSSATRCSCASP